MLHASDPRYQYCPRVSQTVRICRSEAECRCEFGCSKPNCPLEKSFGLEAFDARMKAFSTVFDLWPLSDVQQPDYP